MSAADELCRDCGICCDGTLFSSVALEPGETERLARHRLPVLDARAGSRLELPCAALRGVLCSIYEERPQTCSQFRCELLVRVSEARLSLEKARAIIATTRALRARMAAANGETPWWRARALKRGEARTAVGASDLEALTRLVRRYFWG